MWAMGVLHRLTRDYCGSQPHHDHACHGPGDAPVTLSTRKLREYMARDPRAIREAIRAVALGPARVSPSKLVGKLAAGGHIVLEAPRHHRQGLEAWAGAAFIRSLAASPSAHQGMLEGGAVVPLVRLAGSQDSLERSQARGALRALLRPEATRRILHEQHPADEELLLFDGFLAKAGGGAPAAAAAGVPPGEQRMHSVL